MKLRLSLVILIAIFISFTSCNKDKITKLEAFVYNHSGTVIEYIPYLDGIPQLDLKFTLEPGDSFQIGDGSQMGDFYDYGFYSDYIMGKDSIHVIFNNTYSVTHYRRNTENTAIKHYQPENPRNVMQGASYDLEHIRERKLRLNTHKYYFTEADYDYAKE